MMVRFLALIALLFALPGAATAQTPSPPTASSSAFRSDRIVVETRGRGPDVILIPGLASTSEVWRRTADKLDDRHTVHLVSVRGFGDVPVAANADGALGGPVSAEVRRYIAWRRMDRPAIIGHSMGGLIALNVAADSGARVGRVMVVDSAPFFPSLIAPGATVGDVEPLARIAYQAILFLGDEALRGQGAMLGGQLGGASDTLFGSLGWQGGDRGALAQGLYEVTAPVTVVYGWSPDDASPRSRIDGLFRSSYANLRTPARFEPIEGAEHMVMIDQPTRFQAAVDRFLS